MEVTRANLRWLFPAMVVAALVALQAAIPANGQIPMPPCTASMLTSFTPCMSFLTNSTTNMTTPTPGCCSSLKSLASNGTSCLCQLLTGGIPFRVPINRTNAISLPRACNMAGVPLQCNLATGAPAPAPAPGPSIIALNPPALPPTTATSPSPSASAIPTSPAEAPVSDATPTVIPPTNASPTASTEAPPTSTVTPTRTSTAATSAAGQSSLGVSPSLLLVPLAIVMSKFY